MSFCRPSSVLLHPSPISLRSIRFRHKRRCSLTVSCHLVGMRKDTIGVIAPEPSGSPEHPAPAAKTPTVPAAPPDRAQPVGQPREIGGPAGPEPTRYGDWERNGRCTDF